MAVTYVPMPGFPDIKTPKLHRVVYGRYDPDQSLPDYTLEYYGIREWCELHCSNPFYFSPGWTDEKFIEFEDNNDATLFALRWAK